MDVNEIWEENKRWILGVLLGLLVFWILSSVLSGLYDPTAVARRIQAASRSLAAEDGGIYSRESLAQLRDEEKVVATARNRLEQALDFQSAAEFQLEGHGVPALYLDEVSRNVKKSLLTRADALGIEVLPKDVDWPEAEGPEQIQHTLLGLALLQQAMGRLLDAHQTVREKNFDALGLVTIESFKVAGERGAGRPRRSRVRSTAETSSAVEELAEEANVRFQIRVDEPTLRLFLESLRSGDPKIELGDDFKVKQGSNPGDPLVASGTLVALQLRGTKS